MARFDDLPDELLLKIAGSCSGNKDLQNLCLLCKNIKPVAEEVLYRNLHLSQYCGHPRRCLKLIKTLTGRPQLAKLVRNLTIKTVHHIPVDGSICKRQCGEVAGVIQKTEPINRTWVKQLHHDGWAWIGLIFVVARVQCFTLRGHCCVTLTLPGHQCDDYREGEVYMIPRFFPAVNAPSVARYLRQLKIFNVHGISLGRLSLLELAPFDSMVLGFEYSLPKLPLQTVKLRTFRTRVSINHLKEVNVPDYSILFEFLRHCPRLVELSLWLNERYYHSVAPLSYASLLRRLEPVASTLEVLDLGLILQTNIRWLDSTGPMETLTKFPRLKRVIMPQEALFPRSNPMACAHMLPPSIEYIEVHAPDFDVISIYKDLVSNLRNFPNLKLFMLCFRVPGPDDKANTIDRGISDIKALLNARQWRKINRSLLPRGYRTKKTNMDVDLGIWGNLKGSRELPAFV